jgi:hypothetical protein
MADYTTTFADLDTLLQSLPANTTSTPYSIIITGLDGQTVESVGSILNQNSTKYIDLRENDFSNFHGWDNDSYRQLGYTFQNCESLIYGPTCPTQLDCTFKYCTNLKSFRVKYHRESSDESDYYFGCCAGDIYDELAFIGCTSLEHIYVDTAEDKADLILETRNAMSFNHMDWDMDEVVVVSPEPSPTPDPPTPTPTDDGPVPISARGISEDPLILTDNTTISSILDRKYIVNAASKTITVSDSTQLGVRLTIVPLYQMTLVFKDSSGSATSSTVPAYNTIILTWNGSYWVEDGKILEMLMYFTDSTQATYKVRIM